ncbi:MAG: hypothetical protein JWN86_960 [Planctomycetota bacterium]|nr:hypothetical protein [Planctomycetota bacterium]
MHGNKFRRFWLTVSAVSLAVVLATTAVAIAQNPKKRGVKTLHVPSADPRAIQRSMDAASAPARLRALTYRGLVVTPAADANGQALTIQKRIAAQMGKNDFVPVERLDHFQWYEASYPAKIIGWTAEIVVVTPHANGYLIKVKVSFVGSASSIVTTDHMIEYYDVSKAAIRHIGSEAPGGPPEIAIF